MLNKCLNVLGGVAILSSLGSAFSMPSYAADIQFSCVQNGAYPTTIATNTATGRTVQVVRWYSEYFSGAGYDPQTRCDQVSARFQRSYNNGSLDYITAGIVNGLPVVCAATAGGSCNGSNILFTLKPRTNAAKTLQRIFDVRDLGAGPLYESSGRTYVNLTKKIAPIMGESTGNKPAVDSGNSRNVEQPSVKPSKSGGGSFF